MLLCLLQPSWGLTACSTQHRPAAGSELTLWRGRGRERGTQARKKREQGEAWPRG